MSMLVVPTEDGDMASRRPPKRAPKEDAPAPKPRARKIFPLLVSAKERAIMRRCAEDAGLSMGAWLRAVALSAARRHGGDPTE